MSSKSEITIALIGCGHMGSSLVKGWVKNKIAKRIEILEPKPIPEEIMQDPCVHHTRNIETMQEADVVVLAVKPQIMDHVCDTIKPLVYEKTLILSIAAGIALETYENLFDVLQPVVRAMPNTPSAVGEGMIISLANANVNPALKGLADSLLRACGEVEWISDETIMDTITALSGSGPAYVFYLIELLAHAGVQSGLDERFAQKLARQTVIGAAQLAKTQKDIPAEKLRENVTSPGGTTEAALKVLMHNSHQKLYNKAIKAARDRGKQLNAQQTPLKAKSA